MYALRIREAIDLLPLEEGSYVPDMDAGVEAELVDGLTTRSARAEIVVTAVIAGAGFNQDCMPENLLPCLAVRFNVGVLHVFNVGRMLPRYGRRRSWWTGDQGLTWGWRLLEWKRPREGEDT